MLSGCEALGYFEELIGELRCDFLGRQLDSLRSILCDAEVKCRPISFSQLALKEQGLGNAFRMCAVFRLVRHRKKECCSPPAFAYWRPAVSIPADSGRPGKIPLRSPEVLVATRGAVKVRKKSHCCSPVKKGLLRI